MQTTLVIEKKVRKNMTNYKENNLGGWIPLNRMSIPIPENQGKQGNIVIREYIAPRPAQTPVHERKGEDSRTVLVNYGDDNPTVLLDSKSDVRHHYYVRRLSTGEEVEVTKNDFVIGKGSMADYIITGNPTISRQHAKIVIEEKVCWIRDMRSTNSSFIDDQIMEDPALLMDGSRFRLAEEEFEFIVTQS
jgi:pSer/pThr/pTyr-binding forkhead associated (FHA) protein